MGASKAKQEVGSVDWARVIVRRYEAGQKVPRASLDAAKQVLDIKPGTLLVTGRNPKFDRLALAAGAND